MRAIICTLLALIVICVLTIEAGPYLSMDEVAYAPYLDSRHWLLIHVVGSSAALLTGPVQLLGPSGERLRRMHRWVGRVYLLSIAVASVGATALGFNSAVGWTVGASLLTLTAVWVTSSWLAVLAIRSGRLAEHRQWAIRSYVLTFGFITFRLVGALPIYPDVATFAERTTTAVWLSWTIPLFLAEVAFSWRSIRGVAKSDRLARLHVKARSV